MKKIIKKYLKIRFILIFAVLYGLLFLFAKIKNPFQSINPTMDLIVFIIIPQIIYLIIYAALFSLIIGASYLALKNKLSLKVFSYLKYFLGNFLLLLPIFAINLGVFYLITKLQIFQSYIANAILYTFIPVLLANFLILSFFFHTIKGQNIFKSIKNSILISSKNYHWILLIEISYLIISKIISYVPSSLVKEAIYFIIIYPVFSLIITEFFENVSAKR